jgi:hypothetical protein
VGASDRFGDHDVRCRTQEGVASKVTIVPGATLLPAPAPASSRRRAETSRFSILAAPSASDAMFYLELVRSGVVKT